MLFNEILNFPKIFLKLWVTNRGTTLLEQEIFRYLPLQLKEKKAFSIKCWISSAMWILSNEWSTKIGTRKQEVESDLAKKRPKKLLKFLRYAFLPWYKWKVYVLDFFSYFFLFPQELHHHSGSRTYSGAFPKTSELLTSVRLC